MLRRVLGGISTAIARPRRISVDPECWLWPSCDTQVGVHDHAQAPDVARDAVGVACAATRPHHLRPGVSTLNIYFVTRTGGA
jgi:hypothetical protein